MWLAGFSIESHTQRRRAGVPASIAMHPAMLACIESTFQPGCGERTSFAAFVVAEHTVVPGEPAVLDVEPAIGLDELVLWTGDVESTASIGFHTGLDVQVLLSVPFAWTQHVVLVRVKTTLEH